MKTAIYVLFILIGAFLLCEMIYRTWKEWDD